MCADYNFPNFRPWYMPGLCIIPQAHGHDSGFPAGPSSVNRLVTDRTLGLMQ